MPSTRALPLGAIVLAIACDRQPEQRPEPALARSAPSAAAEIVAPVRGESTPGGATAVAPAPGPASSLQERVMEIPALKPWLPPSVAGGAAAPVAAGPAGVETAEAPPASDDLEHLTLAKPQMPPGAKIYPKNVADKPVPRIGSLPWMIAEDWRAKHERQLQSPKRAGAKVLFLGDSIVEGWGSAPAYRERFVKYTPLNLGIAGDYTQNVLWRIDHGALEGLRPDAAVILVGVNNLAGGFTPEQTAAGVRSVVGAVRARLPSVPLVLLGILPARRSASDPLRQKIADTNRLLAKLAGPGVSFQDVGSVLLEPDQSLSKLTAPDALHPSAGGYERLTAAVAPLLEKLVKL